MSFGVYDRNSHIISNIKCLKKKMKPLIYIAKLLIATLLVSCSSNEAPTITILHTNDTHSQIEPSTGKHTRGGVVERASIIEKIKQDDPSVIYLDGGDMVQGSPYFNIFKGEVEVLAMNQQGLNAATLGNHEFDNGLESLAEMLSKAKFPMLSCNYDCSGTPIEPYVKRSMIIKRNGVKIGLSGVTCDPNGLIFNRNWEGIKYLDPIQEANKVAKELRDEKCDLVILISHIGYDDNDAWGDRNIAINSKDIDIIIGGHSHTNIENGYQTLNADGKPIWITQTGGKDYPIGRLKIEMQKATGPKNSHRTTKFEIKQVLIDKIHPDSLDLTGYGEMAKKLIRPFQDSLQSKMSSVIGIASETMLRNRPQSLLSNFTADALKEFGEQYYGKPMDMGIMNFGGLRSDLDKGDITIGTMFRIYPFENALTILEIKGEYLEKAIKAVAGKKLEAFSGSEVVLTTKNNKTEATTILIGGKPIDQQRIYYVATIDYLAEGNDGLSALTYAEKTTNTGILLRDVMTQKVKELTAEGKNIESQLDNRVIDL